MQRRKEYFIPLYPSQLFVATRILCKCFVASFLPSDMGWKIRQSRAILTTRHISSFSREQHYIHMQLYTKRSWLGSLAGIRHHSYCFYSSHTITSWRSGATRKVAVAGRLQDGNLYGVVELAATEPLAVGKTAWTRASKFWLKILFTTIPLLM